MNSWQYYGVYHHNLFCSKNHQPFEEVLARQKKGGNFMDRQNYQKNLVTGKNMGKVWDK